MDKDYNQYSKIAVRSDSYDILKKNVKEQLLNPASLSKDRLHYANKLVGSLDGKASERIIDYLLENK
jgi:hypothetical protein